MQTKERYCFKSMISFINVFFSLKQPELSWFRLIENRGLLLLIIDSLHRPQSPPPPHQKKGRRRNARRSIAKYLFQFLKTFWIYKRSFIKFTHPSLRISSVREKIFYKTEEGGGGGEAWSPCNAYKTIAEYPKQCP